MGAKNLHRRLAAKEHLPGQHLVDNTAQCVDVGWRFGRVETDDTREDESGTYALHTLKENETIARLATGVKRFVLPEEFEVRETLSLSGDRYPDSAGYFLGSNGKNRSETLLQAATGLWSPSSWGVRAGLRYEYTTRISTAEAYSFNDHRVLLQLAWRSDSDRFGVSSIPAEGRVPMQHGVDSSAGQSASDLQIRDLIRQDEAVQRGSSCLK